MNQNLELEKAKSLLMKWCNDSLTCEQVKTLEKESIAFCFEIDKQINPPKEQNANPQTPPNA